MSCIYLLLCIIVASQHVVHGQDTNVTVRTSVGTFIGFQKDVKINNKVVKLSKFLGIPYAEPPIGSRRFRKPVMKAAISDPLVTKSFGPICLQFQLGVIKQWSEDCLTLNIYAPVTTSGSSLAVMVWIHGGGYAAGSASEHYYLADFLASRGDVIVVTFNYRLAQIGFLNLGNGMESNFGLWDQQLAIQWVHNNIEAFGGDKSRVTIFGQSAGSGSVIYQGLYPGNQGLFQRIIAESGSASSPWSETLDYKEESQKFVSSVGCRLSDPDEVLKCLQSLSSNTLNDELSKGDAFRAPIPYAPSVDGDFVKVTPKITLNPTLKVDSAARRVFGTFDVLTGFNGGDGGFYLIPLYGVIGDIENFLPNKTYFDEVLVPTAIQLHAMDNDYGLTEKYLIQLFTTWTNPDDPRRIRQNFITMHAGVSFIFDCLRTLDVHRQYSSRSTYMYQFDVDATTHILPTPSWMKTSNHGDDLRYVFGETDLLLQTSNGTSRYADWENELSKNMMIMWTNFAKTGNPNLPTNIGVDWNQYSSSGREYLKIGKFVNETMLMQHLFGYNYNFWNKVRPAVDMAIEGNCQSDTSGSTKNCMSVAMVLMTLIIKGISA